MYEVLERWENWDKKKRGLFREKILPLFSAKSEDEEEMDVLFLNGRRRRRSDGCAEA